MRHHNHQSGFTLVELLIGSSLSAILLVGVLSSFTFMGRSLGRMASQQQLETQSRRALQVFDSDARMATALSGPTNTSVTLLNVPDGLGGTNSVVYSYSGGTLTRTVGANPAQVVLRNIQTFDFDYYDSQNVASASTLSIKQLMMSFTTAVGTATSGTRSTFQTATPRIIMRNKALPP